MPRLSVVLACTAMTLRSYSGGSECIACVLRQRRKSAHVVYEDGSARTPVGEHEQVGCERIKVAGDGRTVGWSAAVENCGTSCPIPIAIVVYRRRKQTVIAPDQLVWEWQFIYEGKRVAV